MLGRYNLAILFLLKVQTKIINIVTVEYFMICSVHFNIQSEGSISQFWDTVRG